MNESFRLIKLVAIESVLSSWKSGLIIPLFFGIGFLVSAINVINGKMTLGELVAINTYIPMLYTVVDQLSNTMITLYKSFGTHEKAFEYMCLPIEDEGISFEKELNDNFSNKVIRFDNVSFKYETSKI